jgi:hypothetical protein
MRFKAAFIFSLLVLTVSVLTFSCKKEKILSTGGSIRFSTDTLKFDTVFTAAGSYTNSMLIYNPQNEEVVLSSVKLQSGAGSYFHLNVNGFQGRDIANLKIPAHDSIYVFATVNVNPSDSLTPFYVTDALIATMNGKQYTVPFTAYGQNAHYIIGDSISTRVTWLTDKPYVVIHSCVVGPTGTLNIPKGCKVYMHQDARFFVYNVLNVGTLPATGSSDSVVFQGDRLDRAYFGYLGYPGEWGGFYFIGHDSFSSGRVSIIQNAVIKNCGGATPYYNYAVQPAAIEVDANAAVIVDHSVIKNGIGYGILNWGGALFAFNSIVHTTGAQALINVQGGYDSIVNCTFASYGTSAVSHSNNGTVAILNYFNKGDGTWNSGDLYGVMTNCIVYGSLDTEIVCDSLPGASAYFKMDHCLLKMGNTRESFVHFYNCIFNQDPMFKNTSGGDFHPQAGSPAVGAGISTSGGTDLDGKSWNGTDIGCYRASP